MKELITVALPDGTKKDFPKGIKLIDIAMDYKDMYKDEIVGAIVDNELRELWYYVDRDCDVKFIDTATTYGNRFYSRSLSFLLIIAAQEVLKDCHVTVEHSLSKGIYCEINYSETLTEELVKKIEAKMRELVAQDLPFAKLQLSQKEAVELFDRNGQEDKVRLFKHRKKEFINVYKCCGYYDYFYGYMVPSTGYLKVFELLYYPPGLLLRFPEKNNPVELPVFNEQKKLFNIFREFEHWGNILELDNVGHLNEYASNGRLNEIVHIAEALHEKKIAQIADLITYSKDDKKLVLIAGPSSSGKTTFAQRLSIQLRVNGLKPVAISIDDFFKNREDTPKTPDGEYDFETIDAIDVKTFNKVMAGLINGEEVELPVFNFKTGQREWKGKKLKINDDQILVVEGIHGLNEILTQYIPKEKKFKIYISALTHLNIDNHNRIPTSDLRLIRRIVRDYQFRSSDALLTIRRWDSVRRGEDKYIYPFQEEADVMFNSSLVYELSVLRNIALPQLQKIDNQVPEYIEAKRLIKFLNYFMTADGVNIPNTSILKEFIGGSCFFE